jgi:hypothetical protein
MRAIHMPLISEGRKGGKKERRKEGMKERR